MSVFEVNVLLITGGASSFGNAAPSRFMDSTSKIFISTAETNRRRTIHSTPIIRIINDCHILAMA